ncbi:MAG TPA: flagellar biosynthetic protein FliO [Steroidobacter sp.]
MSASSLAAEQPFAAPKAAEPVAGADAGSLVQVTLSLLLVLGCVFAAAWLMRRMRNLGRPGAGAIEVVADVALGMKERAVLVQVGKQQILLGVAPGRVSTLHVLSEPVHVDRTGSLPSGEAPDGMSRPTFKSIFKRSLGL